MRRPNRPPCWMMLLVLILIWIAVSACSCSEQAGFVRQKLAERSAVDTEATSSPKAVAIPTATLVPTPTATLVVPTVAASVKGQDAQPSVPQLVDQRIDMTYTEAELNELIAGQSLSQQGVEVEDVTIRITAEEIIAEMQATYAEAGISAGIVVRGVPVVYSGDLYVKIDDVELDDSVSGFVRLIADQLVKQAIDQYATEYGILVPQEEIVFESVELAPQRIHILGERR